MSSGFPVPEDVRDRQRYADTIEAIKAIRKRNGDIIASLGALNRGDGGGGEWIYNAEGRSALTEGVGSIFQAGDGIDDYLELRNKSRVDIRVIGAHPDAPAENNRSKIQAAIDAAQGYSSGTNGFPAVKIPSGVYQVNRPLEIDGSKKTEIMMYGQDFLYTQIRPSDDFVGDSLFTVVNSSSSSTALERAVFRDFYFRGVSPNFNGEGVGVQLNHCVHIPYGIHMLWERMLLSGAKYNGMLLGYNYSNTLRNCWLSGNKNGLYVDNAVNYNNTYLCNQFINNSQAGCITHNGAGTQFLGNNIELNGACGIYAASEKGLFIRSYGEANGVPRGGINTGSITAGNNVLTLGIAGRLDYTKVGQKVLIYGAGDEGPSFDRYDDGREGPKGDWLITSVTAIDRDSTPNTVTLADNAVNTVSNAKVRFGGWTFETQDDGVTLLPKRWHVNADIILNGAANKDLVTYDLTTNVGSAYPVVGADIGGYTSPVAPNQTYVAAYGAQNVTIQQPGYNHGDFNTLQVYGTGNRNSSIRVLSESYQQNGVKPTCRVSAYIPSTDNDEGEEYLATSSFEHVPKTIVQFRPEEAEVILAGSGGAFSKFYNNEMYQRDLYELAAPADGSSSDIWGYQFDLNEYPELAGRLLYFEVAMIPLAQESQTNTYLNMLFPTFTVSDLKTFHARSNGLERLGAGALKLTASVDTAPGNEIVVANDILGAVYNASGYFEPFPFYLEMGTNPGFRTGDYVTIAGAGASGADLQTRIMEIEDLRDDGDPMRLTIADPTLTENLSTVAMTLTSTTGTVTSAPTDTVTVADGSIFEVGDWVKLEGAGAGGADYYGKIDSIATNTLTMDRDAETDVTDQPCSIYRLPGIKVGDWITLEGAGTQDIATTGSASASSAVITVADSTGFRADEWITLDGAGSGGSNFIAQIESVDSGTVITLKTEVETTVTDEPFKRYQTFSSQVTAIDGPTITVADQLQLAVTDHNLIRHGVRRLGMTFRAPSGDDTKGDGTVPMYMAFRSQSAIAGSRALFIGATIRAAGNPVGVLETIPNYRKLHMEAVEITVPLTNKGVTIASGGTGLGTFRVPYAFRLTKLKASCKSNGASECVIDCNKNALGSMLSTKLTIDATETTSATAASSPVVNTYRDLDEDDQLQFDIDSCQDVEEPVVTLIGYRR